jgi:hypothetical protein
MTLSEVQALINTSKVLEKEEYKFQLNKPKQRIKLTAALNEEMKFLLQITRSQKKSFKVTLFHQDSNTHTALLRIDYNGRHPNPEEIIPSLPEEFHPYAGKMLDESHIHLFVEGYKPLTWALPLKEHEFPVKEIKNEDDLADAIRSFCKEINLISEINFDPQYALL